MKNVPKLRFKEFPSEWQAKKISSLLQRVSNPVAVKLDKEYQQIGIRSHGKGIFHKELVTGAELGNKRVFWVEENTFVVNIVFAWEQAVAKTSSAEKGMIASHRFPMYKAKENEADINYIFRLFLTDKGKYYLGLASPGGAGRNKTLGQKNFEELDIIVPDNVKEQTKIADFLTAIDDRISQLSQKCDGLALYKKGVMQKIFSQELRFKDEKGRAFPAWEEKRLGDIGVFKSGIGFPENIQGGKSGVPFYKVSDMNISSNKNRMIVANNYLREDQISSMRFKVINECAIIFAKVGAAIFLERKRIASNFLIDNNMMAFISSENINYLKQYFDVLILSKFAQTGALPSYNGSDLAIIKIKIPSEFEQEKIAGFLSAVDEKISQAQAKLDALKQYKQGLLQQIFV